MDDYYYERNQFPGLNPFAPFPGYGGFGGFGQPPQHQPRPALPASAPRVPQPVHYSPVPYPAQPIQATFPPPPMMPMSIQPPPGAPPWMGPWAGPCGSGLLGGVFGNRRLLPILIDNVLKGWAAFSGTPQLPTGSQLNEVSNLFQYLDSAAQYVKRDEQIRFFGGLARDIL